MIAAAHPHVAWEVLEFIEEVNIQAMNWPPKSPHTIPIEHIWDTLKRAITGHNPPLKNLKELKEVHFTLIIFLNTSSKI